MHSATFLAKENRDLRAANEKQKQKGQRSNKRLSHTGSLSIQEARELISHPNQAGEASNSTPQEPMQLLRSHVSARHRDAVIAIP
jgi:hypothetical protein